VGSNDIVLDGVSKPQEKERFGGQTLSQNMQLQIAAKLSVLRCHEELAGIVTVILPFPKLLWSLFT